MAEGALAETPQRWTARRRATLVLSLLRGEASAAEGARKHGPTVAQVEEWREFLLAGAENGLRSRPRDQDGLKDEPIKQLRQKVGSSCSTSTSSTRPRAAARSGRGHPASDRRAARRLRAAGMSPPGRRPLPAPPGGAGLFRYPGAGPREASGDRAAPSGSGSRTYFSDAGRLRRPHRDPHRHVLAARPHPGEEGAGGGGCEGLPCAREGSDRVTGNGRRVRPPRRKTDDESSRGACMNGQTSPARPSPSSTR